MHIAYCMHSKPFRQDWTQAQNTRPTDELAQQLSLQLVLCF
jgi:hypothetical protein